MEPPSVQPQVSARLSTSSSSAISEQSEYPLVYSFRATRVGSNFSRNSGVSGTYDLDGIVVDGTPYYSKTNEVYVENFEDTILNDLVRGNDRLGAMGLSFKSVKN